MCHVEKVFSVKIKSTVSIRSPIWRLSLQKTGYCFCLEVASIFLSLVFEKKKRHCKWRRSCQDDQVQVCFGEQGWRRGARVAQWWEHSPPINVARVQIPASTPYVSWVCCWFSPLFREVFLPVLRFSPLLKNQHFQIPIRPGIRWTKNHYMWMCYLQIVIYLIYLFICLRGCLLSYLSKESLVFSQTKRPESLPVDFRLLNCVLRFLSFTKCWRKESTSKSSRLTDVL